MSFASTCSLNLGLGLQSEELKHSQLLSSPGLTYSRCFWKPLLKGTLKTCKAELLNKSICEGENQFPKTWWIAELRVMSRFELHVAVAFFWWCILPFILCIWKGNSPQISCVGDSRASQGSEHRLSPLFRLSLGSVTCCGKEWCVTQGVNSWAATILCGYQCSSVFFCEKTGGVHNQVCSWLCWCWARSTTALCEVPASAGEWISSAQLDFHYSREVISLICFWQQDDFFFPASAIP